MNSILSREKIAQEIKTILANFDRDHKNVNYKKGFYIYGSPGCGKTHFVMELLNSLNYDIIKYDAGDIRNKAVIDTITSNNVSNQNVLHMMTKTRKKIVILMDEIDGMNNGDKGGITALIKLIRQKKTKKQKAEDMTLNPIICIGNYGVDKKIRELMKVCNVFELKTPTPIQMNTILTTMIPSLSDQFKTKLVKYIQGDMRKLAFVEKMVKQKPELLTETTIDHIFHEKSFNEDAKHITQTLLETHVPMEKHNHFLNDNDRTIVALLWHENIVDHLTKIDISQSFPFYLRILENMCYADYIDRITFQNQIWQFNEMSSLMKTFYNNKIYHDTFNPSSQKRKKVSENPEEIRFTKVLTKYSTEYNNALFVFNICQILDMDRKDLVAFFQELRLYYGDNFYTQNDKVMEVEKLFDNNISRLDIRRMYRYLDKNVKNDVVLEVDDDE